MKITDKIACIDGLMELFGGWQGMSCDMLGTNETDLGWQLYKKHLREDWGKHESPSHWDKRWKVAFYDAVVELDRRRARGVVIIGRVQGADLVAGQRR